MKATKILNTEIADLKISSLPSRPTAPTSFGGRGYTSADMKEAFDKLPLFIIDRFNTLLEDIAATDENSLAAAVLTGISDDHNLKSLFEDITSGEFAKYLYLGSENLGQFYQTASLLLSSHTQSIMSIYQTLDDSVMDGGAPSERNEGGEIAV